MARGVGVPAHELNICRMTDPVARLHHYPNVGLGWVNVLSAIFQAVAPIDSTNRDAPSMLPR